MIKKDDKVGDVKFVKEYPFMSFGSMCNSYGLINHGKGISIADFKKDMKELFNLAKEFVRVQQEESVMIRQDNDDKEKKEAFGSDDADGLFNSL